MCLMSREHMALVLSVEEGPLHFRMALYGEAQVDVVAELVVLAGKREDLWIEKKQVIVSTGETLDTECRIGVCAIHECQARQKNRYTNPYDDSHLHGRTPLWCTDVTGW